MKKSFILVFLCLSGCISISTYEQQMKKYRERADELEQVKAKLGAAETKNSELQSSLREQSEEREVLKSEISNVRNTYDELVQELKDDIANGAVGVKETAKGLTITMGNQILFASGKAGLQPRGKKVLMQVAGVIKKTDNRLIQVEGHTDNLPIATSLKGQFPSNWELSSARSAAVVRFLQEEGKIEPARLVLTAFSEYRPLAENGTSEGRQQNRRVEITLLPQPL